MVVVGGGGGSGKFVQWVCEWRVVDAASAVPERGWKNGEGGGKELGLYVCQILGLVCEKSQKVFLDAGKINETLYMHNAAIKKP